ncbi:MAG: DUF4352 domain-containing protein [Planctomycetes bacterium]|nr:DUF4352 domain-containing protein [Planctomycetota bacterium]
MPIKFQCECGKALTAKDGSEGKRAKCPACQRVVTIPAASELRLEDAPAEFKPPEEASPDACPSCGQAMGAEAVLCVQCGYDRRTKSRLGPGPEKPKTRVTFAFPFVKVAIVAGAVGLLVAGWFLLGAPLLGKMNMMNAVGYVNDGKLARAQKAFEELRPKLSGADQERADLWLKQIPLEMAKNAGKTLDQGGEVKPKEVVIDMKKPTPMSGALVVPMRITNHTKEPLTLRNAHFYLRGVEDIVLVATHQDNSLDGVVVGPGETREGRVVFRKMPEHPVRKGKSAGAFDSAASTYYYLSFNDGTHYVKRMLPF